MILRVEKEEDLNAFEQADLFSVRIKSLLKAYGTGYNFVEFYKQLDSNGVITAIMSRLDSDLTLSHRCADMQELVWFIEALHCSSLLTDENFDYPKVFEYGIIMFSDKKAELPDVDAAVDEYPKLMDLFDFQNYERVDFESWYVDLSHRIRHGCAAAASLNIDGLIVSSGIFSSIYNGSAVLISVLTRPEFRGRGFGRYLVTNLMCRVPGRVFLMREQNKNEEFYSRCGFKNCGRWRMYG